MATQPFLPFDDEPAPGPPGPPAPRGARLIAELSRVCGEQRLAEKILVAPSLLVGHQIVERLAREGHPLLNLRVETVRTLAHALVGPGLAREGWKVLSRAQALAIVEQACSAALKPTSYFGALRERPGLHRALQKTLEELRAAGIAPEQIPPSAFSDRRKPAEIRGVLARYMKALEAGRAVDSIEILRRAIAMAEQARPDAALLYLLPADLELSALERRFLEGLAGERLLALPVDAPEDWAAQTRDAKLFRAIGEENELREAFRRILAEGIPFDEVEVLHTDASVYPSLAWELSQEHDVPCTFAGGIAVTYTHPGQGALAFLEWIADGFAADRLREALASRALTLRHLTDAADSAGSRAAARAIREAKVGWGRRRHLTALDRLIAELEGPERRSRRDEEPTEEEKARRAEARARRLAGACRARQFTERALALAPDPADPADYLRRLAQGTGAFVAEFGAVDGDLDAAARTAIVAVFREIAELPSAAVGPAEAVERLRDAVLELSVAADRPRAGRMHVAYFGTGGFSGRRHTFLVGLDDARHPGRDLEDPVLLDDERRAINAALPEPRLSIERERPREAARALHACVSRLRGRLTASYSKFDIRNLSQSGEPAPSPFFLDLFRETSGRRDADYGILAAQLEKAEGFVPSRASALDDSEWWLASLRDAGPAAAAGAAAPLVRAHYPWLADGHAAIQARASDEFTIWDGRLGSGAAELDPRRTGEPFSPSRIQALAHCPFAYFLRHVLHVEPPEDLERDPTRWLEPKDEGSLLHEVFRHFFDRITADGQKPHASRHLPLIEKIADERIEAWRERIPPRSDVAFLAQRDGILVACRTFLAAEAEHCLRVTPRWFEVPFGMARAASDAPVASAEPVAIALSRGDRILLRGSIDRVDEAPDGSFEIWDYKTGGAFGIQEGKGLRGGRQAQPALYAMALESLLLRSGREARVSASGYFFPGRKGEGQRMTVPVHAGETVDALERLFDLVAAGMFPHAVSAEDCKFCDFTAICGGANEASERSKAKLDRTTDAALAAFRDLHDEDRQ